jgi:hypothetical protein
MKKEVNFRELKPLIKMGHVESAVVSDSNYHHRRVCIKVKFSFDGDLYSLVGINNGREISFSNARALVKYLKDLGITRVNLGDENE